MSIPEKLEKWAQRVKAQAEATGEAKGEARGEAKTSRDLLRLLLQSRFGKDGVAYWNTHLKPLDIAPWKALFKIALKTNDLSKLGQALQK